MNPTEKDILDKVAQLIARRLLTEEADDDLEFEGQPQEIEEGELQPAAKEEIPSQTTGRGGETGRCCIKACRASQQNPGALR